MSLKNIYKIIPIILITIATLSCTSYKQFQYIVEEFEMPSQIYKADYNLTWKATEKVMNEYETPVRDQEAGIISTSWIDNTIELNFTDSFGGNDTAKAAKFKILLNVVKGYSGSREVTKVTIFKRQLVEYDFLQGYKEQHSDGILEKTILYRIGVVLKNDQELQQIDKKRMEEAAESF